MTSPCISMKQVMIIQKNGGIVIVAKVMYVSKKKMILWAVICVLVLGFTLYLRQEKASFVNSSVSEPRIIHMVTGEFKSTTADGKEIEAYRWDPGTIFVKQGEKAKLSILGVNGASHSFVIEGMDISGEVKQGKETVVPLKTDKKGIYRIICVNHPDASHNGPMIGYIVID